MHVIRLRGPWQVYSLGEGASVLSEARRIRLPEERAIPWQSGEPPQSAERGPIRFERWFHWPGEVDSAETLWLVIEPFPGRATIRLNDTELPAAVDGRVGYSAEISAQVVKRNRLQVDVMQCSPVAEPHPSGDLSDFGEVRLEVRSIEK